VVLPEAKRSTGPVAPVGDPIPVLPGVEERRLGHVEPDLPARGLDAGNEVASLRPREGGRPVIGLHVKRVEINIARIGEEGPYLIRDAESAPVEVIRAGQQARPAGIADMEAVLLVLLRPDRLAGEQEAEAARVPASWTGGG
jgi:hypothetical protein